jgi:amicyanin
VIVGLAALGLAACAAGSAAPAALGNDPSTVAAASGDPTTTMDMPMDMGMPGSTAPAGPAVAATAVSINNFAFAPAAIKVKVGDTVTWTNNDEEPHTVFSSAGGMKSPVLASNQNTYSFTFATPGTYEYNCTIHPFMHGTVTVTA